MTTKKKSVFKPRKKAAYLDPVIEVVAPKVEPIKAKAKDKFVAPPLPKKSTPKPVKAKVVPPLPKKPACGNCTKLQKGNICDVEQGRRLVVSVTYWCRGYEEK